MTLSIVSPVYNSKNTISILINEICKSLSYFADDFEIILVDDGSLDNSWYSIENICSEKVFVKGIKLTQNFGQHNAICAGLENTSGEWVIVLDCDLQDNPEEIPKLLSANKDDNKIILAKRMNRKDGFLKRNTSFLFWKVISTLSGTTIHPLVGNFGLYHKDVIAKFIASKNNEPYFSVAMQKFNFKRTFVEVEHQARGNEKSSYSIFKLIKHGLNVLINTYQNSFKTNNTFNSVKSYSIEKIIN